MKSTGFLNCKINLTKKVFSPRAETEFWVGEAIKKIKKTIPTPKGLDSGQSAGEIKILDVFSGSGCIGIAVSKNIKNSEVDFVDISKEAIEQIKINLKLNKISKGRYKVYHSSLFEKLKGKKYDYIFANPPYVALDRIAEVQKEVLEDDPKAALFAGRDGMVLIEIFFNQVKNYLKPAGKIFMEFDPLQKQQIKKIAKETGFKVIFKKDQFGKIRWLETKS